MPYLRIQVLCENIKFVQVKYVPGSVHVTCNFNSEKLIEIRQAGNAFTAN
jgi:hypothetical protein